MLAPMRWAMGLLCLAACTEEVVIKAEGCESCHRRDGEGLETAHERLALSCTTCHGGDPESVDLSTAHVSRPSEAETLEPAERSRRELAWVRFRWPGEPRVMQASCGAGNALGGTSAGCHQDIVDRQELSPHRSLVGITNIPRYEFGLSMGRRPTLAVTSLKDESFAPSVAPRFTYGSLDAVPSPSLTGKRADDAAAMFEYTLTKACTRCHLGRADSESEAGTFRGAGCGACHMPFATDGRSASADPVRDPNQVGHVERHTLSVPSRDATCQACHRASGRIGLSYAGLRERVPNEDPSGKTFNEAPMLGFAAGALVIQDGADDATPADLHQQKGLTCADCHTSSDVHGDGRIRPNMGAAVGIECQDCHGNFTGPIAEAEDGLFRTSGGDRLPIRREGTTLVLEGRDGQLHPLTQLPDLRPNPDLMASHASANHGELECYACHSGWNPNFWEVDRILDLRQESPSYLTGEPGLGTVKEQIVSVSFDRLLLGLNVDGKIGTFMAETAPFSVVTACNPTAETCSEDLDSLVPGRRAVDRHLGTSVEGRLSLSFRPTFAHTTPDRLKVRRCDHCHPLPGDSNLAAVRAVYGYGYGGPILSRTASEAIDLSRMLADDGTLMGAMGTLLAAPLPVERIQRALAATAR